VQKEQAQKIFNFPEFFSMEGLDEEAKKELPLHAFAGYNKDFPIHTKSAAWLSAQYFFIGEDDLGAAERELVEENIKSAAEDWGLDFKRMREEFQSSYKEAQRKDTDHLLELGELKLYPTPNKESTIKAAEHFYSNRHKYPYAWRREIAKNLRSRANDFELIIPEPYNDYIQKAAGLGASTPEHAAEALVLRAQRINDEKVKEAVLNLAVGVHESSWSYKSNTELTKLAAEMDEFYGLHRHYGDDLDLPEEEFFSQSLNSVKQAASKYLTLSNGREYHDDELAGLDIVKAAEFIGGEFEENLSGSFIKPTLRAIKQAAASLDENDARLFELFVDRELNG
jgi:hypothetical protein